MRERQAHWPIEAHARRAHAIAAARSAIARNCGHHCRGQGHCAYALVAAVSQVEHAAVLPQRCAVEGAEARGSAGAVGVACQRAACNGAHAPRRHHAHRVRDVVVAALRHVQRAAAGVQGHAAQAHKAAAGQRPVHAGNGAIPGKGAHHAAGRHAANAVIVLVIDVDGAVGGLHARARNSKGRRRARAVCVASSARARHCAHQAVGRHCAQDVGGKVVHHHAAPQQGREHGGVAEAGRGAVAVHSGSHAAGPRNRAQGKGEGGGVGAGVAGGAGGRAGAGQHCRKGGEAGAVKAGRAAAGGRGGRGGRAVAAGARAAPRVEQARRGLRCAASAKVAPGAGHPRGAGAGRGAVGARRRGAGRAGGAAVVARGRAPAARSAGRGRGKGAAPVPRGAGAAGQRANALVAAVPQGQREAVWHEGHCRGVLQERAQPQPLQVAGGGLRGARQQQHGARARVQQPHPVASELGHRQHARGQQRQAHGHVKGAGSAHAAPGSKCRAGAITS